MHIFFAKNIHFLRKRFKWTQSEMPNHIDISRGTWGNYENNVSEPNFDKLILISQLFGVTIDDLLLVNLEENVHLFEKSDIKNINKNVHLNVHPNVPALVKEPEIPYEKAKKEQVDLLILKQINQVADDVKEIKRKLEI